MGLVKSQDIARDPRQLAYLYPSMPLVRYIKISNKYHIKKAIKSVEDALSKLDYILLPANCVSHRRRNANRRIQIYGQTFYVRHRLELTGKEMIKYINLIGDDNDVTDHSHDNNAD